MSKPDYRGISLPNTVYDELEVQAATLDEKIYMLTGTKPKTTTVPKMIEIMANYYKEHTHEITNK